MKPGVRISHRLCSSVPCVLRTGHFAAQAKDEASPEQPVCRSGAPECLDAFILGFAGGEASFLFWAGHRD